MIDRRKKRIRGGGKGRFGVSGAGGGGGGYGGGQGGFDQSGVGGGGCYGGGGESQGGRCHGGAEALQSFSSQPDFNESRFDQSLNSPSRKRIPPKWPHPWRE